MNISPSNQDGESLMASMSPKECIPCWRLRSYAQQGDLQKEGALYLRPWHLNYAPQFGLRGYVEPARVPANCFEIIYSFFQHAKDVLAMLCQLILSNTFLGKNVLS